MWGLCKCEHIHMFLITSPLSSPKSGCICQCLCQCLYVKKASPRKQRIATVARHHHNNNNHSLENRNWHAVTFLSSVCGRLQVKEWDLVINFCQAKRRKTSKWGKKGGEKEWMKERWRVEGREWKRSVESKRMSGEEKPEESGGLRDIYFIVKNNKGNEAGICFN